MPPLNIQSINMYIQMSYDLFCQGSNAFFFIELPSYFSFVLYFNQSQTEPYFDIINKLHLRKKKYSLRLNIGLHHIFPSK